MTQPTPDPSAANSTDAAQTPAAAPTEASQPTQASQPTEASEATEATQATETTEASLSTGHHEDLGRSIQDAMDAARAAGIGVEERSGHTAAWFPADLEDRPHVSYSFKLVNLPPAPDIEDVEAAVESIEGVQCRIVHPSETAWITATVDTRPEVIVDKFAELGVQAVLTDTSLLRYATAVESAENYARRREATDVPVQIRRRRRSAERSLDRARRAGFGPRARREEQLRKHPDKSGKDKANGDVLYTARDLVTPLRMWIALVLTLPVLVLAYVEPAQFDGWQWAEFALATPVVTWCALPFHRAMLGGVRRGIAALDGASSIAILIAYVWSASVTILAPTGDRGWHSGFTWFATTQGTDNGPELFFDVACGITLLLLIGRRYTIRARKLLIDELADKALDPDVEYTRINKMRGRADVEKELIPVTEINRGDDIVVHLGEVVPADGKVMGGKARLRPGIIDLHESNDVKVGSPVYAGSVIAEGEIKVRAERTGHTTRWQVVTHWLREVEQRQRYASVQYARSAARLLPASMTVAFFSFILWGLISGDYNAALRTALAVLCGVAPTALALSPVLALRLGIEAAARNGVLMRDGAALRQLESADTVIFNRVGTLAKPEMFVETVTAAEGESEEMILRLAGAVAMETDTPPARALVHGAREAKTQSDSNPDLPVRYELINTTTQPSGDIHGRVSLVYVDEEGHENSTQCDAILWRPVNLSHLRGRLAVAATSGGTPIVVRWKGKDRGVITLFDPFKDDADDAVSRLESMGLETVMLTRDTYPVARRFADFLGISNVLAGITNNRKPGAIRNLQASGAEVALVGDVTVRDALVAANVSIMYADSVDLESSRKRSRTVSAVLLRRDVMAVPLLIAHARKVCGIIDRNLFLAWVYNCLMLLFAVMGAIPPIVATVLMLGSSLLIEGLSMRARRFPQTFRH